MSPVCAATRRADHFLIEVPFGSFINPITKGNWEGTGVEPDVKVPAGRALEVAEKLAQQVIRQSREPECPVSETRGGPSA